MIYDKNILKVFEEKKDFMQDRIQSGIEANRKGWATLKFVDAENKPVENVHVKIRQKTHEFKYGANLFMLDEFSKPEQNEAYRKYFADAFNLATLPFYWNTLEPEQGKPRFAKDSPKIYRRPAPDLCLEYCEAHGIEPKAHCLNYSNMTPQWATGSIQYEKQCLEKRFRELAERYAKRIPMWEVTNETFWYKPDGNTSFYQNPDFVDWSFKLAEKYFPANKLVINEAHCRIWDNMWFMYAHSPYYMQIERAMLRGARIDEIGMQYHMFYRAESALRDTAIYYDPEQIYAVLDTYAMLGKPMHITELTIPAYSKLPEDEAVQAEIIRNIYSMWFSHPAVDGIIYWNLVDGFAYGAEQGDMQSGENYYHGGLLRYDFSPKPAYNTIRELFGKTWRTNTEADSVGGKLIFKGFYGKYELEITGNGKTLTKELNLTKEVPCHETVKL